MLQIKNDIVSGLVVFIISLPLCLGIAIASGAPLISGLVAGVVGGIVVSLISSSQVSVSGPAAGLTLVILDSIHRLGSFELFLTATLIAGLIQISFGLLKFGFLADYAPTSVIKGMLVAIGVVVIIKQIPHALGRDLDYVGDFRFSGGDIYGNSLNEIIAAIYGIKPGATMIALVSLAILLLWPRIKLLPKFIKIIPSPLIVVIVGILINSFFNDNYQSFYLSTLDGSRVAVPENFSSPLEIFNVLPTPDLRAILNVQVWITAFLIAIVASIETLLSLEAADKLDPKRRISNPNQELFAQGIGNIFSGLLGGLPITSLVLRTSANIEAGAESRFSSLFNGIFLFLAVIFLPTILNQIPLSALAAILIIVGYKLCNFVKLKEEWDLGFVQFVPFVITVLAIVFSDLLTGIVIGSVIGLFFVLRSTHRSSFTMVSDDNHYLIRFNKDVSFLNKSELKTKLSEVPENSFLILDGTKASVVDHDIKDLIRDFIRLAKFKRINVEVRHIQDVKVK